MIKKQFSDNRLIKEILNKLQHLDYLDHEKVIDDLSRIDGIGNQLDYLVNIKLSFHDKLDEVRKNFNDEENECWIRNYSAINDKLTSNFDFESTLRIQKPVNDKFFANQTENPEFTFWFLKFNAGILFEDFINSKIMTSTLDKDVMRAQLDSMKRKEAEAKKILTNETIDIYFRNIRSEYSKEITLLRVISDNYYQENSFYNPINLNSLEVYFYYKHKLLKPYFERLTAPGDKSMKKDNSRKNYSQKQVAIAYFFLDTPINEDTYQLILKKHTKTKSNKILQKRFSKTSQLTSLKENKTADTKHLNDLKAAKRLISGMNHKDAEKGISQVISTFQNNFKRHYQ